MEMILVPVLQPEHELAHPFCPIIDLQVVGLYLKKVVVQNSFSDQCSAKAQAEQLT